MKRLSAAGLMMLAALAGSTAGAAEEIRVDALVKLIEEVELPAREAGTLTAIAIREGQLIQAGELLGQVDDSEARLALEQAEAELELAARRAQSDVQLRVAERAHRHAISEFKRVDQVRQSAPNVVSAAELEKYRWEMDKAELEVERLIEERRQLELARNVKAVELAAAKHAIERRKLIAPLNGIVVQLYHRAGEAVQAGERIARVVRIDRVRAEAFVPLQADPGKLENLPAVLEIGAGGLQVQQFPGKVVFVHPEIDPVNNQVRIWVELENSERKLFPGHRGRLTIQTSASPAVKSD